MVASTSPRLVHRRQPSRPSKRRNDRELACYRRLQSRGVTRVCGHNVPILLGHDDALGVLEMTVVARPYVLDFATVTLDQPPDFPKEVLAERQRHWSWVFGAERWARVQIIIAHFQRMGIYLLDPNPRNIAFSPEEEAAWAAVEDARDEDSDSSDWPEVEAPDLSPS